MSVGERPEKRMRKFIVLAAVALILAAALWFGGGRVVGWLKALHGQ